MILKDIKKTSLNENTIVQAFSRDMFTVDIMFEDLSVKTFKYEDLNVMEDDIQRINNIALKVLCE